MLKKPHVNTRTLDGINGSSTRGKKQRLKPNLSGSEHFFTTTTRGTQVPNAKLEAHKLNQQRVKDQKDQISKQSNTPTNTGGTQNNVTKELTDAEKLQLHKDRRERLPFTYKPVESIEIEYDEYDGKSERGAARVADRNARAYSNYTALLNYDQALENRKEQFETDTAVTAIRRQNAEQQYIRNQQIRDLQIQAQLEAYELNQQRVKDQLAFNQDATKQALLSQEQLLDERLRGIDFQTQGIQLDQAQRDLDFSSTVEGIRAEVTGAENQFSLNKRAANLQRNQQLQQSFDAISNEKARSAYSTQETKIQQLLETGTQAARGQKGNSARRAIQSIQALSGINTARIADDLLRFKTQQEKQQEFIRSSRDLAVDRAKEEQRAFKERASLERATIEIDYEVANNRMNLTLEELGESMLSATNAFENEKIKIFQDKFQADAQAMASEMLKPRFADPSLPPFVIPDPKFQLAPLPVEVPKGQLPPPAPSGPSGLSKALMIGGAVIAAVGSAGVALPLSATATIGSGGVAAIGAGISSFGSGGFLD